MKGTKGEPYAANSILRANPGQDGVRGEKVNYQNEESLFNC